MRPSFRPWLLLDRHDPDPPANPPPVDPPANPPPPPPPPADPPETFDQAAVDRIVSQRLAREREKFADYDDLKTKAERLAEIEAANQTELEKAQARADAAESERDQFKGQMGERNRADVVLAAAREAKFIDPAQAYALIDSTKLELDEAGLPTNATDLVGALATASPHLVGTPPPPPPGDGDGGPKPNPPASDFSSASHDDFAKGLEQYGLRPRT